MSSPLAKCPASGGRSLRGPSYWQANQTRLAGQYQAYGTSLLGSAKQQEAESTAWGQMAGAGSTLMGGIDNLTGSVKKLAGSW